MLYRIHGSNEAGTIGQAALTGLLHWRSDAFQTLSIGQRAQSPRRHAFHWTTRLEQERRKRLHEQIPSFVRRTAKFQILAQEALGLR